VYLCVPYGYDNNQQLFPYSALAGLSFERRRDVFPLRYGRILNILLIRAEGFANSTLVLCTVCKGLGFVDCWLCRKF
jgi:hypothetical protein